MGFPIVTGTKQTFGVHDVDVDGNLIPTKITAPIVVASSDPANVVATVDPANAGQFTVADTPTAFVGDATITVTGVADDGTVINVAYVVSIGVGAAVGAQVAPIGKPAPR